MTSLKERAHQLYEAEYNVMHIYLHRFMIHNITQKVQLATLMFYITSMQDDRIASISFIGKWGHTMEHPQRHTQNHIAHSGLWYNKEQFLYGNNNRHQQCFIAAMRLFKPHITVPAYYPTL